MGMNRDNAKLVVFENGEDAKRHGPGGAVWADDESHLYVVLPGGRDLDAIAVTRCQHVAQANPRTWLLTQPREAPTLHPSISVPGQWHGWLVGGHLISC